MTAAADAIKLNAKIAALRTRPHIGVIDFSPFSRSPIHHKIWRRFYIQSAK